MNRARVSTEIPTSRSMRDLPVDLVKK